MFSSDSGHAIQSKTSGFVSYVSGEQIVVKNFSPLTFKIKNNVSIKVNKTKKSFFQVTSEFCPNGLKNLSNTDVLSNISKSSRILSTAKVNNFELEKQFKLLNKSPILLVVI